MICVKSITDKLKTEDSVQKQYSTPHGNPKPAATNGNIFEGLQR
jgi:hypothetical protein